MAIEIPEPSESILRTQPKWLSNTDFQLYALSITQGLVFWYAIEKLFEIYIGFSTRQIVVVGIIAQAATLLFDIPTSVFADRWSRRNVIIVSQLVLIVCVVVLGLSTSLIIYVFGILLWSLGEALISGTYEAFAYDNLAQAKRQKEFRPIYARMNSLELITLGLSSLAAGLLTRFVNLRINFFLTIIPLLLSIVVLLRMKEPKIIRTTEVGIGWLKHLSTSLMVLMRRNIRWAALLFLALISTETLWYEYYQLIGIDIKLSTTNFGLMLGIITVGLTIGAEIARKSATQKWVAASLWAIMLFAHLVGLRFRSPGLALMNILLMFIAFGALRIYLEVYLHNQIESERRATIISLVTTLALGLFFISGLTLAWVLPRYGIRTSMTIIALPLLILAIVDGLRRFPWVAQKAQR